MGAISDEVKEAIHKAPSRLRNFIPNLPGDSLIRLWMVKYTIVQTGNHETFLQQCLGNTINLSPSSEGCVLNKGHTHSRRALKIYQKKNATQTRKTALAHVLEWKQLARYHYYFITCVYLYILLKNRLVALVSVGASSGLANELFGLLDCAILGRIRFIGRTNRIGDSIGSTIIALLLVYRCFVHFYPPKFKFFALEFMLSNQDEVSRNELMVKAARPNGYGTLIRSNVSHEDYHVQTAQVQQVQHTNWWLCRGVNSGHKKYREGYHSSAEVNSIFYLRNPFKCNDNKWILRPNRTLKNWRTLYAFTRITFYWSLVSTPSWFLLFYWLLGGTVLSNLGFEISYPTCVTWLRNSQFGATSLNNSAANNGNYSYLYLTPKVLAHEIRLEDIPAIMPVNTSDLLRVNAYSFARIAFDMLDNHLVYCEFLLVFLTQFYLLAIHSLDVALNSIEIKKRLRCLLKNLSAAAALSRRCYSKRCSIETNGPPGVGTAGTVNSRLRVGEGQRQLREEIDNVQAILADHFDTLTLGYNLFVSFFVVFAGLFWFGYTVTICTWLSAARNRVIEIEFVICECCMTAAMLVLISATAMVRSQNIQIYSLITRAMALDSDFETTKPRWITILKYFYPRSIFCFTLFGSIEISLLLSLKILTWIISAFILLANFFYINRL